MQRRNFLKGAAGASIGAAGLVAGSGAVSAYHSTEFTLIDEENFICENWRTPDITYKLLLSENENYSNVDFSNAATQACDSLDNNLDGLYHPDSPHPDVLDPIAGDYPIVRIEAYTYDASEPDGIDGADARINGSDLEGTTDALFWAHNDPSISGSPQSRGFRRSDVTHGSSFHGLRNYPSLTYGEHPHCLFYERMNAMKGFANAFLSSFIRSAEYADYWSYSSKPPAYHRTTNGWEDELCEGYLVEDNYWSADEYEASYLIQFAPNRADAINNGDCNVKGEDKTVSDDDSVELRYHNSSFRPYMHPFSGCTAKAIRETVEWMGWDF